MDQELFDYVSQHVDVLAVSNVSTQVTKDAAQAWKDAVAADGQDVAAQTTEKLFDVLEGRPTTIDEAIAFAQGPAKEHFGEGGGRRQDARPGDAAQGPGREVLQLRGLHRRFRASRQVRPHRAVAASRRRPASHSGARPAPKARRALRAARSTGAGARCGPQTLARRPGGGARSARRAQRDPQPARSTARPEARGRRDEPGETRRSHTQWPDLVCEVGTAGPVGLRRPVARQPDRMPARHVQLGQKGPAMDEKSDLHAACGCAHFAPPHNACSGA